MASRQVEKEALLDVLNSMSIGILLVDGGGGIQMMNRSAKSILSENDGLAVCEGTLQVSGPESEAFQRLFTVSPEEGSVSLAHSVRVLTLSRPSGRRPFSVMVRLLSTNRHFLAHGCPAAAVFVTDPEHAIETRAGTLCRLYGPTPAEATLALMLLQGRSLKQATRDLKVTDNTTRTHLKRIFLKIGVSRQSDLVRLLLGSPAVIENAE